MKLIGIIKEGKTPPDSRVPLTPEQCKLIIDKYADLNILVQPSDVRCFSDKEYSRFGIKIEHDLRTCDFLLGVKEVPVDELIPNKTYLFFSHTTKKQPHNKHLLQNILEKGITLIDYELLTKNSGERVIAFGRFAGISGAYEGLKAYGRRTGDFELPPIQEFKDLEAIYNYLKEIELPPVKVVLTGSGRVAKGAEEVLHALGVVKVLPAEFIFHTYDKPVYTLLDVNELYAHESKKDFEIKEFFNNPEQFRGIFKPYMSVADVMINGIYWNPKAPVFFSKEEMRSPDFHIKTIADITCDIEGSVPATLRATTIAEPVMGYDPNKEVETAPFGKGVIDVMSVDNLPNELPRDASAAFGEQLIVNVLDELLNTDSEMIERATIAKNGKLTPRFAYLQDWVDRQD